MEIKHPRIIWGSTIAFESELLHHIFAKLTVRLARRSKILAALPLRRLKRCASVSKVSDVFQTLDCTGFVMFYEGAKDLLP